MACRPSDSRADGTPSPTIELDESREHGSIPFTKEETSPLPPFSPPVDIQQAFAGDNVEAFSPSSSTTAGRKRKLNSTSSRGVANLTPDQLAKKRANDRQAQRAIRERTKSRIEVLEQKVRDLSSQKPFLDLQGALRQNETIRAENRQLRQGLKAVMGIIQPLLEKSETAASSFAPAGSVPTPSDAPPLVDPDQFSPSSHASMPIERAYTESTASIDVPSPSHSAPLAGSRCNSANGFQQTSSFRVALDSQRHNLHHGLDFGVKERLGFNFLLGPSQNVPKVDRLRRRSSETLRVPQPKPPSPIYAQPLTSTTDSTRPAYAAPIRNVAATCTLDAILLDFLHTRQHEAAQGIPQQKLVGPPYPSVSSLLNPQRDSHPVSKVCTDILRAFPNISSLPEQVATLYVMFLLMRWQIYPTQENYDRLPDWLTPRASQLLQPHPAWIDYIPWPRMRDHLVAHYPEYPFEDWFIPFTRDLSVNWPYEATDCLLSASDSEELIINPVFERHLRNLSNWSLGPLFAESYPGVVETTRIKLDSGPPAPTSYPS